MWPHRESKTLIYSIRILKLSSIYATFTIFFKFRILHFKNIVSPVASPVKIIANFGYQSTDHGNFRTEGSQREGTHPDLYVRELQPAADEADHRT